MANASCLCGTVRWQADGPFEQMAHCHCSMCRKAHGSMFATYVGVTALRITDGEATIGRYQSSAQGVRPFCRTCGAKVPAPASGPTFVPAGNFLEPIEARPTAHMFVASKAPWFPITDDVPRFDAYPPGFDAPSMDRPAVTPQAGTTLGSCLCGQVAFEWSGLPGRMMNCHCTRCRRARSAAHATNLFVPSANFRFTRGTELVTQYKLPEAVRFGTAFCSNCGSHMPRAVPGAPFVVVPAGALDTAPDIEPLAHIFVADRANWFTITDGVEQFEAMAPMR